VHSHLEELGPGAKGYGNGNLERAYYNQWFTNDPPQRPEKRTEDAQRKKKRKFKVGITRRLFSMLEL